MLSLKFLMFIIKLSTSLQQNKVVKKKKERKKKKKTKDILLDTKKKKSFTKYLWKATPEFVYKSTLHWIDLFLGPRSASVMLHLVRSTVYFGSLLSGERKHVLVLIYTLQKQPAITRLEHA